jgi:two-component system, sensor histidine kinase PdtaS
VKHSIINLTVLYFYDALRDKGEIQIKLFKEEKAGNELSNDENELTGKVIGYALIVSDDGVGIPEKIDLERV